MFFPNIKLNNIWKIWYNNLCSIKKNWDILNFKNIRNLNHKTNELEYLEDSFDLSKIDKVILHSIPFWFKKWFSHLILEFTFSDWKNIYLSVEARRQPGEWFSISKWMVRHFGLIFIWWTENDLIWLRRDVRKFKIESYELDLKDWWKREWLLYFVDRTNKIIDNPEYYNTFFSNCTTNLWDALNKISKKNISYWYEVIFSAFIPSYLKKYEYIK